MSTNIELDSKSGARIPGAFAEPPGEGKAPGLIVIQEWWGLNDHIRSYVDRFAKEGFVVVSPDLYHGKTTKDPAEALKLVQGLDWGKVVQDVAGALAYLESHPRVNGKVGITGFCVGGAVSLAAAANLPGLRAVVPFYGIPDAKVDVSKIHGAVLGHYAKNDDHIPKESVDALTKRLQDAGKDAEIHFYDAGHAFMNDTRPEAFDAASQKLAWDRSLAFLKKHLA